MQAHREGPGCHVGLAPDIPNSRGVGSPLRPRRGLELKEADVTGHLVVGPRVELTLADGGIEKPVTRDAVSAGRIVDGGDDPLLPACLPSRKAESSQRPPNQGAEQRSPLHEYRSM